MHEKMDVVPGVDHSLDVEQRAQWGARDSACGRLRVDIPSSSCCSLAGQGESCEILSSLDSTHSSTASIACPLRSTADRVASLVAHAAVSFEGRDHGSILSAMSAYSSDNSEPNTPRTRSFSQEPFVFSAADSPRARPSCWCRIFPFLLLLFLLLFLPFTLHAARESSAMLWVALVMSTPNIRETAGER